MTMLRPSWENRGQALGAREKGTKGKKMCGNENGGNSNPSKKVYSSSILSFGADASNCITMHNYSAMLILPACLMQLLDISTLVALT